MNPSRILLVRSTDGAVWHLQLVDGSARCGAALRNAITVCGDGRPRELLERVGSHLPLCPMCF